MKKMLLLVTLVAVLVPLFAVSAGAQDVKKALSDYVLVPGSAPVMAIPFKPSPDKAKPPSYCKPCLFYTGDFNSSSSEANGLFNAQGGALGSNSAAVYGAFTVPKGKTWTVTALIINTLSNASAVDSSCTWDIRKGVTAGNGGTDVATGTGADTWKATGRSGFGLTEYTNKVTLKKSAKLKAGTYFMNVLTSCTTSTCTEGSSGLFYESDQESQPGTNQYGPNMPWDDSFFNSSYFGYTYALTNGSSGPCGGIGCDQFSIAAQGTQK